LRATGYIVSSQPSTNQAAYIDKDARTHAALELLEKFEGGRVVIRWRGCQDRDEGRQDFVGSIKDVPDVSMALSLSPPSVPDSSVRGFLGWGLSTVVSSPLSASNWSLLRTMPETEPGVDPVERVPVPSSTWAGGVVGRSPAGAGGEDMGARMDIWMDDVGDGEKGRKGDEEERNETMREWEDERRNDRLTVAEYTQTQTQTPHKERSDRGGFEMIAARPASRMRNLRPCTV